MEDIEYVYTVGMDDETIAERLDEASSGVLSLADDGRAYAIPVHVTLDEEGGRLLFRLTDDTHSEKMQFVEKTNEATFICYDDCGDESWSVMARGTVRVLPDDEMPDEATINELYGEVRVFDEDVRDLQLHIVELTLDELTGRETPR
ncbi:MULTISPECIES: pyridoxamine 5'-phosphate oxidase family protein [Haloferax]|uniref:Pyridoxamine 5'-phosphate oxidase family protein n=1 Tax=Haloferax marinum TaxID=2666143 RepID=A0A6A8G537_9EURY|nr:MULTISPECIES: pyridoxamine 5'-phosphate oxidase family protein [Haloferax]KAB1196845.1 pyridoxamine 5'-phosphate oxidase family protein [Haloferax sp. CBA1150]MRW95857.1 pyridoxamine 5'-phosphate oxidase family protein [Haloferax marinum]